MFKKEDLSPNLLNILSFLVLMKFMSFFVFELRPFYLLNVLIFIIFD
jgi:hypothetical protein